jgi:hypothetical protein
MFNLWVLIYYYMSQSQSYFVIDSLSVSTSWYQAHSGTCDQILRSVRRLFSEICCLVFLGRPLWQEVGSVICLSLSSNLPLLTSNIYITCVLQFSNLYTINIKLQSVPSEYSRLCSVSYGWTQSESESELLCNWQSVSQSVQSQSYFVIDSQSVSQSVRLGVEPTVGLPLEVWCLKLSVLSLFGRPLWREVGSVICQSKSVVTLSLSFSIFVRPVNV